MTQANAMESLLYSNVNHQNSIVMWCSDSPELNRKTNFKAKEIPSQGIDTGGYFYLVSHHRQGIL